MNFIMRIFLVSLLLFLTSCYGVNHGAGYRVRINIDKQAEPTINDLELITGYLDQKRYEVVKNKEENSWRVKSYKIFLNDKNHDNLKNKYIMLVTEYYIANQSNINPKMLEKIEISIGNTREGSNPLLKAKIDSAADFIINKLTNRFGVENISIERKVVTPM
jgi:hypothetical protein